MRKLSAFLLILILILSLCIPALAARPVITTPATGYQDADDVQYKTYSQSGKTVIANWGARGETCTFLSSYAEAYYTGSYTWDTMSQTSGGTTTSNTPSSALYRQLKTLMSSTHTFYTYYDGNKNVRDYYKYTDCVRNDTSKVSLFYFGTLLSSTWNGGTSWNQEHVWPKSKLSNSEQIGDIMHLRPADPTENSRRSNTAYGESGGYYDPGLGVRGDCARTMLYMYVRWGATSTMWGTSGVMESLTILLKWMEEDPVDTWEMGRNDSVQSITGTRNVFVDYPEYAWLLFGKEIPENMDTPSGNAGTKCRHQNTEVRGKTYADCTLSGYTGDTYCLDCGECIATGTTSPATGHLNTTTENQVDETCTTDGYTGDIYCYNCDEYISTGTSIPATGHLHTQRQNKTEPTCGKDGYTGDVYCLDCQQIIYTGITKPATGNHSFSEWLTRPGGGGKDRVCQVCGHIESQTDSSSCAHVSKYTVTVQPTCTAKGYGGNYCEKCGEYLGGGKEIPATGHQHTEIRNKAAASCTSDGYTGDTWCTDCNTKIKTGQSIPATGHKSTEIRDAKEGNCTTDGYTGDTYCTDCGTKTAEGEVIPATGHKNTEIRDAKDATCATDGYTGDTYCTDCGVKTAEGEVIPAAGHKNTEIRDAKDATCATDGYTGDTYCTDCGVKTAEGEVIPAAGHKNTEVRDAKEANCTTDGYTGDTYCTDCGVKTAEGEVIPAAGHKNTEIRDAKEANCATDGYTGDTYCTDCGAKTAEGEVIPAAGHKNTEIQDAKDATCATDGYTGDTYCTDCNTKTAEGEAIPAAGHKNTEIRDAKDATCATDGYTGDTYCTDCGAKTAEGEVIPAAGHKNTEVRGQKDATCAEAGSTGDTYCTDCGQVVQAAVSIPSTDIPHRFDAWLVVPGGGQESRRCEVCGHMEYRDAKTGDSTPSLDPTVIGIAAAAVIIVGGGITATVILKRKKH